MGLHSSFLTLVAYLRPSRGRMPSTGRRRPAKTMVAKIMVSSAVGLDEGSLDEAHTHTQDTFRVTVPRERSHGLGI